jgi:hypothetical protein
MDALKCGACGGDTFSLSHRRSNTDCRFGGSPVIQGIILVRCVACKSISEIKAAPAALTSEGPLCGGWGR